MTDQPIDQIVEELRRLREKVAELEATRNRVLYENSQFEDSLADAREKLKAADAMAKAIDQVFPNILGTTVPGEPLNLKDARRAYGEPWKYEHE